MRLVVPRIVERLIATSDPRLPLCPTRGQSTFHSTRSEEFQALGSADCLTRLFRNALRVCTAHRNILRFGRNDSFWSECRIGRSLAPCEQHHHVSFGPETVFSGRTRRSQTSEVCQVKASRWQCPGHGQNSLS